MSQTRIEATSYISQPTKLARTDEQMFVRTMVEVSTVMDMLCTEYNLPRYYRVDSIDQEWARKIHPDNLLQQARNSLALSSAAFGGHLDSQNDPRPLMCPVPVIHRIIPTRVGLVRHAKIGYTRKACYEASLRIKLLQPIIEKVCKWYGSLKTTRKEINNELFALPSHPSMKNTVVFPVHCKKSVGLSPFIDGIIRMQTKFELSKEQCVGLCYNVLTNERPFYFWDTCNEFLLYADNFEQVNHCSAVSLGVLFHEKCGSASTVVISRISRSVISHTTVENHRMIRLSVQS